jgi:hypothetical protein
MLTSNKNITILLVILFIVTRLLFIQYPFWGLEYEDSFIYTDTGRYLGFAYDYYSMPFKCQSCLDGSYIDCYQYGSFGGHFLSIPFMLAGINWIFGFHSSNIFILNFIFSLLIVGSVIFLRYRFNLQKIIALNIFLLFLIITPFITIFNTSGLAETVSSFFVIAFLFSIYKTNESNFNFKSFEYWLTILFLFSAVLIKRENFVLIILLYSIPIIRHFFNQTVFSKSYLLLTTFSTLTLYLFSLYIGLFEIENNEGGDIGSKTFSFDFLIVNLKQFLTAITNLGYWGLTGFVFIFSIAYVIYKSKINKLGLMCLLLSLCYIIIYSSHYRSYYQVVYNLSHPFETLRYSANYLPLIVLFISTIKIDIPSLHSVVIKRILNISLILIVFTLILNVVKTRIEFYQDETISRIQPVKDLLTVSTPNDILITDIPIVFRCYADENQKIVDLFSLKEERFQDILNSKDNSEIYFLKPKDMKINSDRYGIKFNTLSFKKIAFNSVNYDLLKYSK